MPSFSSRMNMKSKSRERVTPSSPGRGDACHGARSRCPPLEEAMQQQTIQKAVPLANQREGIFEALAESVIACGREGKILHINAAALTLFEVASASLCRGTGCQQFLHSYQRGDEQPPALSLEPWLMSLVSDGEETTGQQEAIIVLRSEEHTSELQSHSDLVCRLLLEKKKKNDYMLVSDLAHDMDGMK